MSLRILFCASEVEPFSKTGGLADVTGSLPEALASLGAEVVVLTPKYRGIPFSRKRLSERVRIFFVEHGEYFDRDGVYGDGSGDYPDNLKRFSFFCRRSLEICREVGFKPDLVHAHDWQAALVPVYLKAKTGADPFFKKTKSVLTIHNLQYQGLFPAKQFSELGLDPSLFSVEGLEFYGKVNLLKAGILFADAVTTVSPTYAKEILTSDYGYGLEGVIQKRAAGLRGILNGLDTARWNPQSDKSLARRYWPAAPAGKTACKEFLQKQCGFRKDPSIPLVAMVTRLAEQKGLDILAEAAEEFFSRRLQFVLLGDGDRAYQTQWKNIANRYRDRAAAWLGFAAREASHVYAGSDFFLMPSYFEPCGLGQMISMRYGSLPIVRNTGGLADTVTDADADAKSGNGFVFDQPKPRALLVAVDRALEAYEDKKRLAVLVARAMRLDFSWGSRAGEYAKLYRELLKKS